MLSITISVYSSRKIFDLVFLFVIVENFDPKMFYTYISKDIFMTSCRYLANNLMYEIKVPFFFST